MTAETNIFRRKRTAAGGATIDMNADTVDGGNNKAGISEK